MADYNLGTARGVIEIEYKGDGTKKASRDLESVEKKSGAVNKAAGTLGAGLTGAGVAMAGGFALAVKSAQDYEKRLSAVKAVSGASAGEMKQLSDLALELGASTKFSASEGAAAIEELVKAGVSVPDVMNGAAKATVALAAAGEIDLPEAAAIASNAMNQFSLDADVMPNIADKIAGAANASAIDVKEFGYSLSQAGAVASLAGLSFDDTAVAIAEMGNAGIKGSDAGTSLKTFLQNLQPQTAKQISEFKALGLATFDLDSALGYLEANGVKGVGTTLEELEPQLRAVAAQLHDVKPGTAAADRAYNKLVDGMTLYKNGLYDAEGNVKSLAQIQEKLKEGTKDLTAEQKQMSLETLFGSDAIRAAAVLSKNGAKGYDDMAASMGKVTAEQVAATRQDNLAGKWEQLTGSLETMAIQIGQIVIPFLVKLVAAVQKLIDAWSNLSPKTQKIIVIVAAVVAVLTLVLGVVLSAVVAIAAMVAVFAAAGAALLPVIGIVAGVIAILIALAAIVFLVIKNWDRIKAFTIRIWNAIAGFFVGIWNAIKGVFLAGINAIVTLAQTVWGGIAGFFTSVFNGIAGFFAAIWNGILNVLKTVWGFIVGVIRANLMVVQLIIQTVTGVILKIWQAFWGVFGGFITAVWDLIKAVVQLGIRVVQFVIISQLRIIQAIWNKVWGGISSFFSKIWNSIAKFIGPIVNSVKNVITDKIGAIQAYVRERLIAIKAFWTSVFNVVKSVTQTAFNFIKEKILGPIGIVNAFIKEKLTAIKGYFSSILSSVVSVVRDKFNSMRDAARDKINSLLDKVRSIKSTISGIFSSVGSLLYNAGRNIITGLINGVTARIRDFTAMLRNLTNMIPDLKGPPKRDKVLLEENGELIMDGLMNGIGSRIAPLAKMLGGLTGDIPGMVVGTTAATAPAAITNVSNAGPSVHQDVKIYHPIAQPESEATNEALQLAGAFI